MWWKGKLDVCGGVLIGKDGTRRKCRFDCTRGICRLDLLIKEEAASLGCHLVVSLGLGGHRGLKYNYYEILFFLNSLAHPRVFVIVISHILFFHSCKTIMQVKVLFEKYANTFVWGEQLHILVQRSFYFIT
ncbi:uncharacterized protein LOC121807948 [Salvia splendens]|uniref:uncharacterized protein LOC121807948 n=1 Tax=Salvia splendens TaxID=180675 RepID=UPI001C253F6F|nr:uncharacterized protein LOC121807948 [Salvia splendens]